MHNVISKNKSATRSSWSAVMPAYSFPLFMKRMPHFCCFVDVGWNFQQQWNSIFTKNYPQMSISYGISHYLNWMWPKNHANVEKSAKHFSSHTPASPSENIYCREHIVAYYGQKHFPLNHCLYRDDFHFRNSI